MHESFIYYLWQFQYLDKTDLRTQDGEPLQIINPGIRNNDAGPDFLNACIRIGDLEWRGHVEIHVKASDWTRHKHGDDPAFENVVLHVVWSGDRIILRNDNTTLPALELRDRVDEKLIGRYKKLIGAHGTIPCEARLFEVPGVIVYNQMERMMVQRLERKMEFTMDLLEKNKGDWEETTYQLLMKNFGFKVNTDAFYDLSGVLPYSIVRKHTGNMLQIEALLFGMAGMLDLIGKEAYGLALKKEFDHLSRKYGIGEMRLHPMRWKFLRLRPANFPTVRMAQIATLLSSHKGLFSALTSATSRNNLLHIFAGDVNPYWETHYRFGKKAKRVSFNLGKDAVDNLIINTVVPLQFSYSKNLGDAVRMNTAIAILQQIAVEKNAILRRWNELGVKSLSAFDSQALIELHNTMCMKRQCLNCGIGFHLLRNV